MSKTFYALLASWAILAPATALADDPAPTTGPGARITLDYVNAEVGDVLRALAAQSKVNIALKPGVKGQVTVHLRDKTVDDSIQMVASLSGLAAKRVRETYFVSPQNEMKATLERLGVSKSVTLKKLPGKDGAELVSNTFPDVTVRTSGSTLTLIGSSDDVEAAERMITSNDVIAPEKERITVRYPVKNLAPSKLAPALAKMVTGVVCEQAGDGVLVAGPRDLVEAAGKSLEYLDKSPVDGTETRVYNIRYSPPNQLIAMVRKAAPNVEVIPGPEVEVPTTPRLSLLNGQFIGTGGGGSGGGGGGGGGGAAGGQTQQLQTPGTGPAGGAPTTSATGDVLVSKNILSMLLRGPASDVNEAVKVLDMVDVPPKQMSIEARVAEVSPDFDSQIGVDWKWNSLQFVERPSLGQVGTPVVPSAPFSVGRLGLGGFGRTQFNPIATLNAMITSKRAKLLASPNVMVLNDSDASIFIGDTLRFNTLATSGPNTGNQFTVVEVPVGIILLVHPRVNDDGHITLKVHPVVSTVSGFTDGLPQTSAREAETTVRVKDGDTIVIGGLIRDEDIRSMSKIPLLGDLPLIGYLFKKESRTNRRTEITVFLTIRMMPQQ